eukprot:2877974-Rhodomonas_salina.1
MRHLHRPTDNVVSSADNVALTAENVVPAAVQRAAMRPAAPRTHYPWSPSPCPYAPLTRSPGQTPPALCDARYWPRVSACTALRYALYRPQAGGSQHSK